MHNAAAHMPLTQDCPPSLLDSMTGHYNSISTHSTSRWLMFPANIWQGRALKIALKRSTAQVCITMPTKSTSEVSEMQMPPYSRHAAVVLMVSAPL